LYISAVNACLIGFVYIMRCIELASVHRTMYAVCRVRASLNGMNQSVVLTVSRTSRLATPGVRTHSENSLVTLTVYFISPHNKVIKDTEQLFETKFT